MKPFISFIILVFAICSKNFIFAAEPEILFLSTPRSGTHWSLYCLCTLLNKQVFFNRGPKQVEVFPGEFTSAQGTIYCAHNPKDLWIKKNGEQQILILIVRNYREALARHHQTAENILNMIHEDAKFNYLDNDKDHALVFYYNLYFNNLRCYDAWNPSTRYLIYYEDLITKPRETLSKLLDFFHVEKKEILLDQFLKDIDSHIQKCFKFYEKQGGSQSKGKDLLYHTKKLGTTNSKLIDKEVEKLFPYYFNTYLRRYKFKDS